MSIINNIREVIDRLSHYCTVLSDTILWICMAGMSLTVFSQVLARYVFHNSIHWSEELARFLMICVGLIGASSVMRHDSHVAITMVRDSLPPKLAVLISLAGRFAVGIFIFVLIRYGFELSLFFIKQKSPALRISMFIPYSALYISGFLTAIHLINLTIKDIYRLVADTSVEMEKNH